MRALIALLFSLVIGAAHAQVTPGTSPLSGAKGGTNNAFMQFSGPASSLKTFTLPNVSGTIAMLSQIQTWTAAQSFNAGLTVLGSFTATGLVTNADLVNQSTTVNGQTCTLGGACTITAVAPPITVGTTTVNGGPGFLFNSTSGGALSATTSPVVTGLTVNGGVITASSKGHLFGAPSGTPATGAVTTADANILLYDVSSTNWSGIGADTNGNFWVRTGLSGTPAPAFYVDTSQATHFTGGGGVTIGPAVSSTGLQVNMANTQAGLLIDGTAGLSGTPPFSGNYNLINMVIPAMPGGGFGNLLGIQASFGGSSFVGGLQGIQVLLNQTAVTNASSPNRNYVGYTAIVQSNTGDGGTAPTTAGGKGAYYGLNPNVFLHAGATNVAVVSGAEIGVQVAAGASTAVKTVLNLTYGSGGGAPDAVQGTVLDAMLNMFAYSGPGAKFGIDFNDGGGAAQFPVGGSGTLIGVEPTISHTVTNGINLNNNNLIIAGSAFASRGFNVSGVGAMTLNPNPGATGSAVLNIDNVHATQGDWGIQLSVGAATDVGSAPMVFTTADTFAQVGSITRTSGGIAFNMTSDERLKIDHGVGSKGIDDLMAIKVHDYAMKTAPGVLMEGYFAQELYQVYPDAVTVGGDDAAKKPWQVDYGRITPLIVRSIQQQESRIEALEAKLGK